MAKPNYSFEKRQRELARKKKQEEKRQKKAADRVDKTVTPADAARHQLILTPSRSSLTPDHSGDKLRIPLVERHHFGGAHVQT